MSTTAENAGKLRSMRERGDNLFHLGLLFWFVSLILDRLEVEALLTNGAIGISYLCIVGGLTVTFLYSEKGGWKRRLNGFFLLFLIAFSIWLFLTL